MARKKKGELPNLDVNGKTFRVKGHGWFSDEDGITNYFVYSDDHAIYLPFDVNLKRGNHYIKAVPESGSDAGNKIRTVEKWKFYFESMPRDNKPRCEEWIFPKRPLDLHVLLHARHGCPMPSGPVRNKIEQFCAYKKLHGKDIVDIDPGKVIDICHYLLDTRCEDERPELIEGFKQEGSLGYYLGDTILLFRLQCSDFERVFDERLLPATISYDKRSDSHILFFLRPDGQNEKNEKKVRIAGRALFLETPASITKRYFSLISQEGELKQIVGADDSTDVTQDVAAEVTEEPGNDVAPVDGDSASLPVLDDCDKDAEDATPQSQENRASNGTSLLRIPSVLAKARYWVFVYACRQVLNARLAERKKGESGFKNQDALIDEVLSLMRNEGIPKEYLLSAQSLKAVMKSAEAAGHMPDHKTGELKSPKAVTVDLEPGEE